MSTAADLSETRPAAGDVFYRPWNWRPISRNEAISGAGLRPSVAVWGTFAEWVDRDAWFARGSGPYDVTGVRFYRPRAERRSGASVNGRGSTGAGGGTSTQSSRPQAMSRAAAAGASSSAYSSYSVQSSGGSTDTGGSGSAATTSGFRPPLAAVAAAVIARNVRCELKSAKVACSHRGRKPSPAGVLQVVAAEFGDRIALTSQIEGGCGEHPAWTVSGYLSSTYRRPSASFQALPWEFGHWWATESGFHEYGVSIECCTGESRSFQIQAYPKDSESLTVDFDHWSKAVENIVAVIEEGLSAIVEPPDEKFEFLRGGIKASAKWEEFDDYRVFWRYHVAAGFHPLLTAKGDFPLARLLPAALSELGDACVFVGLRAKVDADVRWEQTAPNASETSGQVEGSIEVALGVKVNLLPKKILKAELAIATEGKIELDARHEGSRLWLETQFFWAEAKGRVTVKALWDAVDYDEQTQFWEPMKSKRFEWNPIEAIDGGK